MPSNKAKLLQDTKIFSPLLLNCSQYKGQCWLRSTQLISLMTSVQKYFFMKYLALLYLYLQNLKKSSYKWIIGFSIFNFRQSILHPKDRNPTIRLADLDVFLG